MSITKVENITETQSFTKTKISSPALEKSQITSQPFEFGMTISFMQLKCSTMEYLLESEEQTIPILVTKLTLFLPLENTSLKFQEDMETLLIILNSILLLERFINLVAQLEETILNSMEVMAMYLRQFQLDGEVTSISSEQFGEFHLFHTFSLQLLEKSTETLMPSMTSQAPLQEKSE